MSPKYIGLLYRVQQVFGGGISFAICLRLHILLFAFANRPLEPVGVVVCFRQTRFGLNITKQQMYKFKWMAQWMKVPKSTYKN